MAGKCCLTSRSLPASPSMSRVGRMLCVRSLRGSRVRHWRSAPYYPLLGRRLLPALGRLGDYSSPGIGGTPPRRWLGAGQSPQSRKRLLPERRSLRILRTLGQHLWPSHKVYPDATGLKIR
jgi:hypothetical protein